MAVKKAQTFTLPTAGIRGAEIAESARGRAATPSIYLTDAEWSLKETAKGNFKTAWVAFKDIPSGMVQQMVNEWTKASRQLDCGLSKHVSEHANGKTDVAFRCQAKKPRAAKPADDTQSVA